MEVCNKIYPFDSFYKNNFGTHLIKSQLDIHKHDFWEAFYVISGTCKHIYNGEETIVAKGKFFLLPPFVPHGILEINKDTAIHRDLAFKDTFFKQLCDSIDASLYNELLSIRAPFVFSEVSLDMLEERLHNFSLTKDDDEVLQNRLAKGITYIVLQLISEYSKSDITLNSNFQSILNKLKNPNVLKNGIKQLANDTGYTHNHLCKLFKKNLNQSINSVLTASRMDYAASLLKNTDFCMLEISALVGYESISHFIATFRKYFGLTPNKFKKL